MLTLILLNQDAAVFFSTQIFNKNAFLIQKWKKQANKSAFSDNILHGKVVHLYLLLLLFSKLFSKRHKWKSGCKSTSVILFVLATAENHGTTQFQTYKNMFTESFRHIIFLSFSKTIDYHHMVEQQKYG